MEKRKYSIEELLAPPAEGQVDGRVDRLEGQFDRATANKDQRTVEMSFSSEVPVERYYGKEILSHDSGAVDLTRVNSGRANILVNHDSSDWVGVIEKAWVDPKAKVGRATVRFGNSSRANEIF